MIKSHDKSILIISDDVIIINFIKNNFKSYDIINSLDINRIKDNKYICIILDDIAKTDKNLENFIHNKNIINISSNKYQNAINIQRPFSLKDLYLIIQESLLKYNNTLKFKNFTIYNGIIKVDNLEIKLGNKEHDLIYFLYKNNNASKEQILQNVWGYTEYIETKVLENTISKIKNKFKSLNIDDFIILKDYKYKINDLYL